MNLTGTDVHSEVLSSMAMNDSITAFVQAVKDIA